jgi:hypothetical protein
MACAVFANKGLDSLDYSAAAELGITKDLFLVLKKGKNAFPMSESGKAHEFDADVRSWMLDLCKLKTETPVANPLEFPRLLDGSKSVEELMGVRKTIAMYRDQLQADYMKLLGSVAKAATHIPNPVFSSMLSKMGVAKDENQYYNDTHTKLKGIQTPTYSAAQSAVQRIDKFISNKQNANLRNARARSEAAAAATAQQERNKEAAKYGLPPGSKSENILAARLALLRRGGRRKTKKQKRSTKRRSTRRKV